MSEVIKSFLKKDNPINYAEGMVEFFTSDFDKARKDFGNAKDQIEPSDEVIKKRIYLHNLEKYWLMLDHYIEDYKIVNQDAFLFTTKK